MKFIFIVSLLFSLSSQANSGVSELIETCDKSKTLEFCKNLQVAKKNIEMKGEIFIKNLNLQIPSSALGFMINPQISLSIGSHSIKIKPAVMSYEYEF